MWRIAAKCWMSSSGLPTMGGLWKFLDIGRKRRTGSINTDLVKVQNAREEKCCLKPRLKRQRVRLMCIQKDRNTVRRNGEDSTGSE
jgi:hypothetical protein